MDDQQEQAVALGLRQGKVEAWRALYEAHAEPVWRAVARLLGPSSTEVGDVVQETFLAAARSAAQYDPGRGSLWLWLWGIARNQVALHQRKQGQFHRLRNTAGDLSACNGAVRRCLNGQETVLPEETLASAELAALVRVTLTELPYDYEFLLTAKYLDDRPVEEIAQQLRCTSTAVRSRLARARQAFRQAFEKYTTPPEPDPVSGRR
jgi:RNA polymerase sigma-70 factor (ECF subfamily)